MNNVRRVTCGSGHRSGSLPARSRCRSRCSATRNRCTGSLSSVNKRYLPEPDPLLVAQDQTAGLPAVLAQHVVDLVGEFEAAKQPAATAEARCARDADKLECLLQAQEYQREGYTEIQPWVDTMAAAVATGGGKRLARLAQEIHQASGGTPRSPPTGSRRLSAREHVG